MSELIRFGVSIDRNLLESFDQLIATRNYATRSEALRDLIRQELIRQKIGASTDAQVLGSLTLVYDHHAGGLLPEMARVQHDHHDVVLSVMHIHVSHDDCMEILAVRGVVSEIISLADRLLSLKGIKNGKLFLTLPSSEISDH